MRSWQKSEYIYCSRLCAVTYEQFIPHSAGLLVIKLLVLAAKETCASKQKASEHKPKLEKKK